MIEMVAWSRKGVSCEFALIKVSHYAGALGVQKKCKAMCRPEAEGQQNRRPVSQAISKIAQNSGLAKARIDGNFLKPRRRDGGSVTYWYIGQD